jgi:two-component system, sensor histidine kinase and response regulator
MSAHETAIKFLLVDDLEENLLALGGLLEQPGVELLKARSGREALELLLVHDVALAFIDVQMPEMDGYELAELMRGKEQTQRIPIIFVTAGSREQYHVFRGYDAGAVDFLFKPLDPRILRHKAAVFASVYRQRRELERLTAELAQTLRQNETFVAALSHDLRNPLGAIMMGAELIIAQPDPAQIQRRAERIRSSGKRMAAMIEDLLDLARARLSGGIPIKTERVDLLVRARKVVVEQQSLHSGRAIELTSDGDVSGHLDGDRLEQLISNLLANALRYGTPEVPVRVRIDGTRADELMLVVQNGGALDEELLPRLFDPFSAGDRRRDRMSGLGLGLYIVNQIARSHGGRVKARSSEADGVIFEVELPRRVNAP